MLNVVNFKQAFWGGQKQHLLKWPKGRIHLLKYTSCTSLVGVLPAFIKGIEDATWRKKGSLSTRNPVGRVKKGSEDMFSPSRFISSSSKPLRVSILSSAMCRRLRCGKCCCSVGSAAEVAVCRGRCEAAYPGQEVPGVAAVSRFELRFMFLWSLRNTCSCLKRRRCPVPGKKQMPGRPPGPQGHWWKLL